MSSIRTQLLAINFNISCWEARRLDKKATKEVADNHATATSVGRYHKDLLPGATEHETVLSLRNAWRVWHGEQTLPWGDNGTRVMRSAAFMDYSAGYRERKDQFEQAVAEFCNVYPQLVAQAELRLNSLFDPQDYPDVSEVRRRFSARLNVYPIPNVDDFRIIEGIDANDAEQLRKEAVAGIEAQVGEALKDLWTRMSTVVSAMSNRLAVPHGQPGGKFHDTLVENIRDLLSKVPALNLTGDPAIDALSNEMKELLCAPDTLRIDPDVRAAKAAKAKELTARMQQFMGA